MLLVDNKALAEKCFNVLYNFLDKNKLLYGPLFDSSVQDFIMKNDNAIQTKDLSKLDPIEIMNGIHKTTNNLKKHLHNTNDTLWKILYFVYLTHNPFYSLREDDKYNINVFLSEM